MNAKWLQRAYATKIPRTCKFPLGSLSVSIRCLHNSIGLLSPLRKKPSRSGFAVSNVTRPPHHGHVCVGHGGPAARAARACICVDRGVACTSGARRGGRGAGTTQTLAQAAGGGATFRGRYFDAASQGLEYCGAASSGKRACAGHSAGQYTKSARAHSGYRWVEDVCGGGGSCHAIRELGKGRGCHATPFEGTEIQANANM